MLDTKFIRENPEAIRTAISEKNVALNIDELLEKDKIVLSIKQDLQKLLEEKNVSSAKIAKASQDERVAMIELGRELGKKIDVLKPLLAAAERNLQDLLWLVPNIAAEDAPRGKSEENNVVRREVGIKPQKSFKLLGHVELLELNHWSELERVAKVSGSRSYALCGDMVLLEFAILQLSLEILAKKNFRLITVPAVARESALFGTGHFPTGREQVYHLPEDDLYLSGTAEVIINSLHQGEILKETDLPLLYGGFSPCFRREAGSAGRDVRGLIRVHQFYKVEQFIICKADSAESQMWHKNLLDTAEEILNILEIPYRVIEVCTGDMGPGKYRMHDLESWVPSENKYRETHSCSELHAWQARRSDLRYRDAEGKVQYCYTLNNTAIATPRVLVPLLENHQTQKGTILIPKALQKYLGGRTELSGQKASV